MALPDPRSSPFVTDSPHLVPRFEKNDAELPSKQQNTMKVSLIQLIMRTTTLSLALRSARGFQNQLPRTLDVAFSKLIRQETGTSAMARSGQSGTRLMSSFQPSPPPGTAGTPVYSDIDFAVKSSPSAESTKRNNDANAVFVVTGASRGIGLQFVKSLLERTKGRVVACVRSPDNVPQLDQVIQSLPDPSRVCKVQLDVEDQSSIEKAGEQIKEGFGRVDMLLNVAGILGDGKNDPGPERALNRIDRKWFEKTLAVNLVGPVMLAKELSPLMMQRRRKKADDEDSRAVAVVANLSARVGSISDNGLGGWYTYRMSKSALNQATRTMSLELKRYSAWSIALHPGTTDTDLSKPFQANVAEGKLFPVDFTVNSLLDVIDSMTEEQSGGFFDWAGKAISF